MRLNHLMKSSTILYLVGVAAVMLVIGTALGSIAFPMTKTETTTFLTSVTSTQTSTMTLISYVSGQYTITEEILQGSFATLTVYTSGNCTEFAGGVYVQMFENVTTFVFSSLPTNQSFVAEVIT
jgi:hypothetical protein